MRVRFHLLVGRLMQIRPRTWCALFSGLMLWNGCNFVAPAQASEGAARACNARRTGIARGFLPLALCRSGGAEGRAPDPGRARNLRQPQSPHRERDRAAVDPRVRGRKPDDPRLRRAVHALWAARPQSRDRRRSAASSPSISTRRRNSPTASRSPPKTSCSPGSCCGTKAARTIASIMPRLPKPKRSASARCASISPAAMIASCRSSSG